MKQLPLHAIEGPDGYASLGAWVTEQAARVAALEAGGTFPAASFTASPESGTAPLEVTFTDSSTGSPLPSEWLWDFGDGSTSTVQNPTHTFGQGDHTVTLTVTNIYGSDTATAAAPISVAEPSGDPYLDAVLADNPLGFWRLGEASGTVMADASPNARHGTYVGPPTLGVPGALAGSADTAIDIAASTQYGQVPYGSWMQVPTFTVESWVKPDASGRIFLSRASSSGNPWNFVLQSGGPELQMGTSQAYTQATATGTNLYDGSWHHIVGTYDGATIRVYHDGVLKASTALGGTIVDNTEPIRIGRRGSSTYSFDGRIDEVAFYAAALSDAQILAHYNAGIAA